MSLKIYDAAGIEVAVLFNSIQNSGRHSVTFNSYSVSGGLSAGVYFYKLTVSLSNQLNASEFQLVKKMMIIK